MPRGCRASASPAGSPTSFATRPRRPPPPRRSGCLASVAGTGGATAPAGTPPVIRSQIQGFGAGLVRSEGHIGDGGAAARAYAAEHGGVDGSTLREPYRIEGKKTLGLELAERLGWTLPDVIVYPTGG